jgi:hypothetical protein
MLPDGLLEAVRSKAARAAELGAKRFVERDGIEGTNQWPYELSDEDTIARMPAIPRCQKFHIATCNRCDQLGDSLGRR